MNADFGESALKVSGHGLLGPGIEAQAEAKARDECPVDAEIEPREEFLVADEDEGKWRLGVGAGAGEKTEFLKRGGIEILGFLNDHDGPQGRPFLPEGR
jgi:hypothetical protein